MPFVRQILNQKGSSRVWRVDPSESVANALRELSSKNVAALLVMEGDVILGILSERDVVRKASSGRFDPERMVVAELMNSRVLYTSLDATAEDCMALMTEMRVRHLPVLEHGRLVGLISIGDIVKVLISEKEFLIDQLTQYINGTEKALTVGAPPVPAASAFVMQKTA